MAKNEVKYKSYDEVNKALGKLSELEYHKQKLESDKNLKISTFESVYNQEFAPIAESINKINEGILEFLKANKKDFENSKTRKLPNGTIQCKSSSKVDIPDESKTMELLKKLKLEHCIKRSEDINKSVVKTLDEKVLKQCKINLVKEINFTIKTNHSDLKAV